MTRALRSRPDHALIFGHKFCFNLQMDDSILRDAVRTLPVRQTVVAAYRTVFRQPALLAKAAIIPYLISVIVSLGWYVPLFRFWQFIFVQHMVELVAYTLFGVAWHRLTLLGPDGGRPTLLPVPRRRHMIFFIYVFVATSIYSMPAYLMLVQPGILYVTFSLDDHLPIWLPSAFSTIAFLICFYLLPLYLLARLSFLFPATAVDERYGLKNSWRHTRHEGFRLLASIIATGLPGYLLIVGLQLGVEDAFNFFDHPVGSVLYVIAFIAHAALYFLVAPLLGILVVALVVSTISIAFKTCTGWISPDEAASAPGAET